MIVWQWKQPVPVRSVSRAESIIQGVWMTGIHGVRTAKIINQLSGSVKNSINILSRNFCNIGRTGCWWYLNQIPKRELHLAVQLLKNWILLVRLAEKVLAAKKTWAISCVESKCIYPNDYIPRQADCIHLGLGRDMNLIADRGSNPRSHQALRQRRG